MSSSLAISRSHVASYTLQFYDSTGLSWGTIGRTIKFVDILLARTLKATVESSDVMPTGRSASVLSVKSGVKGLCDDDMFAQEDQVSNATDSVVKHYCGNMEATISTAEQFDGDDSDNSLAYFSRDFLDFLVATAVESFMDDHPIFVEQLRLTYLAPKWDYTHRLVLCLKGVIDSEMDLSAQGFFLQALVEFLSEPKSNNTQALEPQIVLRKQMLVVEESANPAVSEDRNNTDVLEVHITLYQESPRFVEWVEDSTLVSDEPFESSILSKFSKDSDLFVQQYLTGSNGFFFNVHAVRVKVVEDTPTPDPVTLFPKATEPPQVSAFDSLYGKRERGFNFNAFTASVAVLPVLILVIGTLLVLKRRLDNQRQRLGMSQSMLKQRGD